MESQIKHDNMTNQRGYYKLEWDGGYKWLHFGMNFLINLQDLTGKDFMTWSDELQNVSEEEQAKGTGILIYAAAVAYDQLNGNDIDYNFYQASEWMYEAFEYDLDQAKEILQVLAKSTSGPKKKKEETK